MVGCPSDWFGGWVNKVKLKLHNSKEIGYQGMKLGLCFYGAQKLLECTKNHVNLSQT